MHAVSSVILLITVSLCYGLPSADRQCVPDTNDFATKVEKSPVVVYGKAMAKIMNEGSESVFHIFFQVDCILKGSATIRQINITNAGRVEGRDHCQDFPIGRGYSIAFLEPISLNETDHKTFTPTDFTEIADEGNATSALLARTCNLHRIVPRQSLASVSEVCPSVATDPSCDQTSTTTATMVTNLLMNTTQIIVPGLVTNVSDQTVLIPDIEGHMTHPIHTPQQEIDAIRGKSDIDQVDIDHRNNGSSMTFSLLLIIMAIFFSN